MKKIKLLMSFFLVLILAVGFIGKLNAEAINDSADVNVQLIKAESCFLSTAHRTGYREFVVKVKNIAYQKYVAIHHEKNDGSWEDIVLTYEGPANSGYEIWKGRFEWNEGFSGTYVYPYGEQFVVKYTVSGVTYWDNNNNQNYSLAKHGTVLLGQYVNVLYSEYYAGNSTYIYLRNLGSSKIVKAVYTTDNWATQSEIFAQPDSYFWAWLYHGTVLLSSPNQYGVEQWSFSFPSSVTSAEFAISYEVNGVTYWDNNYGANYTLN